jgi:two-component system, NtrC family, response regulator GlrR
VIILAIDHEEMDIVSSRLIRDRFLERIIGRSPAVQRLKRSVEDVSSCDVSVLISGESGTGKELVARAIHYLSDRSDKPFIPVNCGAIPENIFENEMFGHRKGAFTDAAFYQKGLVEEAEGGTLFLDEIGSISPYVQVKLLRFLQDKKYKVLGDSKYKKSNVRVLAATNEDLLTLIKNKSFRQDLYYRINIINIVVPPLRERKEDVSLLIEHFFKKYSIEYQKQSTLSNSVKKRLIAYSWPGNVRELENKIQQLVVMATNGIGLTVDDMALQCDEAFSNSLPLLPFKEAKSKIIQDFEKDYLNKLMRLYRGDVVKAAKRIGKGRTALWNLLSKYNISPKSYS